MLPFGVNLPVSGEKRGRYFMLKATSVPQANHLRYFSHIEALKFNLIVQSKSLPAEVSNLNSTIELYLPVEAKKSLQSYSVDFDFLASQCNLI